MSSLATKKIKDFFAAVSQRDEDNRGSQPACTVSDSINELESDDEAVTAQSSGLPALYCSKTCDIPCECPCCTNYKVSHHPLILDSSKQQQFYRKQCGHSQKSHSRTIQAAWYKVHPWISVCTTRYKVFCATCLNALDQCLLSKTNKSPFVGKGFCNWKNALAKFCEHEASSFHKEAVLKLAARQGVGIDAQLSVQLCNEQKHHRAMLMKLFEAIKYLGRQGLALRGHNEDTVDVGGNLYRLLLLQAKECPEMITWLEKKEYISPTIVNEVINLMGQSVLRMLLSDASVSLWYSVIADEATDISHNEQMSLSIRWIDSSYSIHEDTLGLIQLPNTKAETIFVAIKDILIRCSLPIKQCCGQAYDGAGNMSGIRNGVQALFKKEANHALYVHCLTHSLNLCVKDVTRTCDVIRDIMNFVYELTQLIKMSPKRLTLFDSLRKEITINTGDISPNLRMLCPTRWTVRHGSLRSVLRNYNILQTALEEIRQGHDEYAAKAAWMVIKMDSFDTIFGLKLAYLLFSACDQLSINLQAKDMTVQEAVRGAKLLVTHLQSLRTDTKFNAFYDELLHTSKDLTTEPSLPRRRKVPKRLDDGATAHVYLTPKDRHRHKYFETLELAAGEIERRFQQKDISIINTLEVFLIQCANDNMGPLDTDLEEYLKDNFDLQRLKVQLLMLPNVIKTCSQVIKEVTNVRTIVDAMNESQIYKEMLQEVDKLLRMYLTFPVTSATAERSFSSLRRVKTYLRNTMTSCRLNNLFLMFIHQDKTDKLDLCTIAQDFISRNSRRKNYLGTF